MSPPADAKSEGTAIIPRWIRFGSFFWLLIWFPTYWHTWGAWNFLQMCDVAVILTCIGLWIQSPLLISSQAVSAFLVDIAWITDAAWQLLFKHHLIGGTEYLFDTNVALWIRLLSLFHIGMLIFLIWLLYRVGYDRRGWILQCAIALAVFIFSRFSIPAKNMNFAFVDPFFHRQWGPAPIHLLIIWLFMVIAVYLPTHLLFQQIFSEPKRTGNHASD